MSTFDDDSTEQLNRFGDSTTDDGTTERGTTGGGTADHTRPLATADPLAAADAQPRTLSRPKGPSWSTIALGLVCLVVAGGALFVELTELSLEWDRTGPLALVGLGVLLVLVGLAALMRRSDDDEGEELRL